MFDMDFNAEKVFEEIENMVELSEEDKQKVKESLEHFGKFVESISTLNVQ